MADNIEEQKTDLENLGRLVDRYAQSRSLGLWVSVIVLLINVIVVIGSVELITAEFCISLKK